MVNEGNESMAAAMIGTSHFKSRKLAIASYFKFFGYCDSVAEAARAVTEKLKSGEISIGRPPGRKGWQVVLHAEEGRYMYQKRLNQGVL